MSAAGSERVNVTHRKLFSVRAANSLSSTITTKGKRLIASSLDRLAAPGDTLKRLFELRQILDFDHQVELAKTRRCQTELATGDAPGLAQSLLLEVTHQGVVLTTEDEAEAPDVHPGDMGLEKYPRLRALESRLDQDETVTEFEEALESLLDRLSLLVDSPRRRRR